MQTKTMVDAKIRQASKSDLPEILLIHETNGEILWSRNELRKVMNNGNSLNIVAMQKIKRNRQKNFPQIGNTALST